MAIAMISRVMAMANTPSDSARIRPIPSSSAASSPSCRGSFHTRSRSFVIEYPRGPETHSVLPASLGEAGVLTVGGLEPAQGMPHRLGPGRCGGRQLDESMAPVLRELDTDRVVAAHRHSDSPRNRTRRAGGAA